MTTVELKKELIKKTVIPFFTNNGFSKSGVKFYRDLSFFQIEADIQSQRYYKETGVEKFRINCYVSCKRFTSCYGRKDHFGFFVIQQKDSWITIDGGTELEILSDWLRGELKKLSGFIEVYSDTEKVIERLKPSQDITYAFLLKTSGKDKELTEWRALRDAERKKYLSLMNDIDKEKRLLESRPESLDKTIRLEGIAMQSSELAHKLSKIDKEMQMVE